MLFLKIEAHYPLIGRQIRSCGNNLFEMFVCVFIYLFFFIIFFIWNYTWLFHHFFFVICPYAGGLTKHIIFKLFTLAKFGSVHRECCLFFNIFFLISSMIATQAVIWTSNARLMHLTLLLIFFGMGWILLSLV